MMRQNLKQKLDLSLLENTDALFVSSGNDDKDDVSILLWSAAAAAAAAAAAIGRLPQIEQLPLHKKQAE